MTLPHFHHDNPHLTVGMVGLGRMGFNLGLRAIRAGIQIVGTDFSADAREAFDAHGGRSVADLSALVAVLPQPRTVWVMVPAGDPTDQVIQLLGDLLDPGDCIIDGGNSFYGDDIRHAHALAAKGIEFLDVGTSGGVWGLERGYSLMIGGPAEPVTRLTPLWQALSPGVNTAERTVPGGPVSTAEEGWLHCGDSGAGHFVKMVHNGIEYAIMGAYAEGLNILRHADRGLAGQTNDAETAPLNNPDMYQYDFNLADIAEVWRRGSVIGSWLLDLTAVQLQQNPNLEGYSGRVSDSGEGRWTSIAAIEEGVPTPVLTAALYARFSSQGTDQFANQVLSAMRRGFGGHVEKNG